MTLSLVEFNLEPSTPAPMPEPQKTSETRMDPALMGTGQYSANAEQEDKNRAEWGKTQRNAPCPCGSGKKYKQCHGKLT